MKILLAFSLIILPISNTLYADLNNESYDVDFGVKLDKELLRISPVFEPNNNVEIPDFQAKVEHQPKPKPQPQARTNDPMFAVKNKADAKETAKNIRDAKDAVNMGIEVAAKFAGGATAAIATPVAGALAAGVTEVVGKIITEIVVEGPNGLATKQDEKVTEVQKTIDTARKYGVPVPVQ